MRRASALIACLGAATLILSAQAPSRDTSPPPQAAATTTIRGRVLIAGTDVPVRKARLTLASDAGAPPDPIYADNDGRFAFAGVKPGRYTLSAWKSGFVETKFGARGFWDRHVSIVALAGQVVDDIMLSLEKGAAVSGRVVDDLGEPLVGVAVTVGRVTTADGRPRIESGNFTTETDDLGEYRVGGLPAGTYAVATFGWPTAASPTTFTTPDGRTMTTMVRRPRAVYHPAASVLTQARPITLKSGEDAGGVDVTFGSDAPSSRVVGRIVDPQDRSNSFALSIVSDGDGVPAATGGQTSSVGPTGDFSIAVGPGEYTLVAQSLSGVAIRHVSVGQGDATGILLVLAKGGRISGRVVFDGAAPPQSARVLVEASSPEWLRGAAMVEGSSAIAQPVVAKPDGTFTLTGLVGRRELIANAQSLPGWSLVSITAGGRNLLNLPFDFKGDEDLRDVVIVFAEQTTRLTGTVTDASGAPVMSASVLVFADDRRLLPRRARWVRPDTQGRFVVDGLPAGDYLVALAEDVDDLQWSTAAFLERHRSQATRVTLPERGSASVSLRWESKP